MSLIKSRKSTTKLSETSAPVISGELRLHELRSRVFRNSRLITLYTQLASPGVFGRLLIESPSLFVAGRKILDESRKFRDWPYRVYVGIGTRELGHPTKDAKTVADVRELESVLRSAGLGTGRLLVHIEEGANHSEGAWAGRFAG